MHTPALEQGLLRGESLEQNALGVGATESRESNADLRGRGHPENHQAAL